MIDHGCDYGDGYKDGLRAGLEAAAAACWGPSEDHEYHWIPERRECWQDIQKLLETVPK